MQWRAGLPVDGVAGVVVVNKTAHAETLVVDDAVTVADADAFVRDTERVHGIIEYLRQRVVHGVSILVRTFKEVHTDSRWVEAVALRA